jgi:hypothetical protein
MCFLIDNECWHRYLKMRAIDEARRENDMTLSKELRKAVSYEKKPPLKKRHWAYAQHTPYATAAPLPIT